MKTISQIIQELINKGNNKERAKEIVKEAENSSNPTFIYHQYRVKVIRQ